MPEINIVAERIATNDKVPFLKNVETVYENGIKTLHVTMNDINISASDNSSNGFESMMNEDGSGEFLPLNEMIPGNRAESQSEITPANNTGKNANEIISHDYNQIGSVEFAKKPVVNRVVNKLLKAGISLLMKVNDGLFFKS